MNELIDEQNDIFNNNFNKETFENFDSLKSILKEDETIMEYYTKNSNIKEYDAKEIGWEIEDEEEHGSRVIYDEQTKKPLRKFATTYWTGKRFQVIDLYSEGINEDILKNSKPKIEISENYAARFDCGSKYQIWVALLNNKFEQVDFFTFNDKIPQWNDREWHKVSHVFENYPSDVRYIVYYNSGVDTQYWAGFYGIKITNSTVKLIKSSDETVNESAQGLFERNLIKNPCGDDQYEYWCFLKRNHSLDSIEFDPLEYIQDEQGCFGIKYY